MNLLKIKIIVLLERLKKVTLVAEELGLKQPTVSFHMRKMEEEWELPLFEIKTGKVILTEAGKTLHHYAVRIERLYEEAESRLAVMRSGGSKRKFTIGLSAMAGSLLLHDSQLFAAAAEQQLQLAFISGKDRELQQSLLDGHTDLIVTGDDAALPGCITQKIGEEQLVLLLAGSHPAAVPNLSSYRLAQYPLIMLDDDCVAAAVSRWKQREDTQLSTSWSSDRIEPIVRAVADGQGVSIIPGRYPVDSAAGLITIPLPGTPAVCPLYALWRGDTPEQAFIERFVRIAKSGFGNNS
ncbi:LysR family transcriptional regulator [Paenibacillus sp. GCM10027626]|uniref:LysR family transcriptional regulator n=1 Tax=Paenibacillus sp. GCM10027626 TaxID=3273411 RepID=UPI003640454B